jgi:hypothetical protein
LTSHENIADLAVGGDDPLENPVLLQPTTNLIDLLAGMDISAAFQLIIIEPRPLL